MIDFKRKPYYRTKAEEELHELQTKYEEHFGTDYVTQVGGEWRSIQDVIDDIKKCLAEDKPQTLMTYETGNVY